jgi:hypothetical protein
MRIFKKIKEFYDNEYEGKISFTLSLEQIILFLALIIFLLWLILN